MNWYLVCFSSASGPPDAFLCHRFLTFLPLPSWLRALSKALLTPHLLWYLQAMTSLLFWERPTKSHIYPWRSKVLVIRMGSYKLSQVHVSFICCAMCSKCPCIYLCALCVYGWFIEDDRKTNKKCKQTDLRVDSPNWYYIYVQWEEPHHHGKKRKTFSLCVFIFVFFPRRTYSRWTRVCFVYVIQNFLRWLQLCTFEYPANSNPTVLLDYAFPSNF